ncbi:hypothetical protein M4D55_02370 [Metabacillus idriensis]|uniref:Uncharacterized protein n=1 Tax=Metabacillus idriensis TaxID=324768 RepID=A0A6I2M5D4_9BACI|nr:hypothetical protein [Metabacillus idriensis]MCM3594634.1 hypothetical protein [Metabacillus idriensis]MRX53340.1 hypothetical protein [Metabacillus idriensis]OHR67306.1 hypothetical protein HMPREF3291_10950 [Bacillus sp. HMSC76G11]
MKLKKISICLLILFLYLPIHEGSAQTKAVKVIDVETGDVVKDLPSSAYFTNELKMAIQSMKGITVKVNPLPKKGYLILIQPAESLKVKNKWYDGIVSEGMIVYSKEDSPRLILFTDENKPLFFEISYDPKNLIQTLGIR